MYVNGAILFYCLSFCFAYNVCSLSVCKASGHVIRSITMKLILAIKLDHVTKNALHTELS